MNDFFKDFELIYSYTRAQAIDDGVLIDVTETAKECGFLFPVAVTSRLWAEIIMPDERARKLGQSEEGRLWDMLNVFRAAVKADKSNSDTLFFDCFFIMNEKQNRYFKLKSVVGPGDQLEPVLTIMLHDED